MALAAFGMLQFVDRFSWLTPELVPEVFTAMVVFATVGIAVVFWWRGLRRLPQVSINHARWALLLGLVVGLFSIDRILGIGVPPPSASVSLLQPHPRRGWSLKPSMTGTESGAVTRTNRLGLRGPEVAEKKPLNETRILFIGDSVIFGFALSEESSIVTQCEQILNQERTDQRLNCINAGISGYSTWQERDLLESEGFQLDPDIVVLGFSLQNDVADAALLQPGQLIDRGMKFEFSNNSHWSGIMRAFTSVRARREWKQKLASISWREDAPDRNWMRAQSVFHIVFREPLTPEIETGWTRAVAELTAISDACRKRSIPLVVMVFSSLSQADPECKHLYPQNRILKWGAENAVPVFDSWAALLERAAREGRAISSYFIDDGHPNTAGSRVIAEQFARFMNSTQLLDRRRPGIAR